MLLLLISTLLLLPFHTASQKRELISIHDLTSGESISPQRLRFAKLGEGECPEGKTMVKIQKFEDEAFRGKFLWIFDKDMDYRIHVTAGDLHATKVKVGNSAVGIKFCLDLKRVPSEISISAACERYWFPQGDVGTYVFKKTSYGFEKTAKASVRGKTGKMTVNIEIPKSLLSAPTEEVPEKEDVTSNEEGETEPKPFFWTCPSKNTDKPFDRIRKDYNELTGPERDLYIQAINTAKERGYYDLFVAVHKYRTNDAYAHGTMSFYAWHRKFLLEFENMLRSLDPKFECITIPYWDWAQEYKVCAAMNGGSKEGSAEDDSLVRGHGSFFSFSCKSYMDVSHILKDFGGPGVENDIKESECCSSLGDCDCNDEWCDETQVQPGMFHSFCDPQLRHWRERRRRMVNKPEGCSHTLGAENQCLIETVNVKKPTRQGCVKRGPFKDWVDFEGRRCLVRGNNWDPRGAGAMTGTLAIARIRLQSTTFESFMGATYGVIHGSTHVQVGGHMSTMHSPQDPIFFSHHAFIDKLWSVWQDCHDAHEDEAKMFVGTGYLNHEVHKDKNMPYCLSAEKATFPWLNGKHLPWIEKLTVLKEAMESFDETKRDEHAAQDDEAWACGAHGKSIRVTSAILPSWTDVYTPEKWSDTYNLEGGSGVLYWPDDMDRHSMSINEDICNFDKWKMFGKRIDQDTNKAMMDHQGNNKDKTTMDVSNTNALPSNFLEVSEQIQKHHEQMWTRQQAGPIGDLVEKIGHDDAAFFSKMLSTKVSVILKTVMDGQEDKKPDDSQIDEIKRMKASEVKKVMDELARTECAQLGDEAPSSSPISEPFGVLKAWIGRTNMEQIARDCIDRPQDCSWIPQCKRMKLQDECKSGTCNNACVKHQDDSACSNSPGCVWLEAPAGELEDEDESTATPSGVCV